MNRKARAQGFTIIELMLAMAFVSFLLLAIAMTIIQIGNIYNRGLTLKEVNQAGRSIADELQRNISSGSSFKIDLGTGNRYQQEYAGIQSSYVVQINGSDEYGGRLCLGQYSYIWNYGKYIASGYSELNKYSGSNKTIRFVKVYDPNETYCEKDASDNLIKLPIEYSPPVGAGNSIQEPIELLNSSEHDLALQSLKITTDNNTGLDLKTGQKLYNIEFVISTNKQEAINWGTETCKPPSDIDSNTDYCSINKFSIAVRSGNR